MKALKNILKSSALLYIFFLLFVTKNQRQQPNQRNQNYNRQQAEQVNQVTACMSEQPNYENEGLEAQHWNEGYECNSSFLE